MLKNYVDATPKRKRGTCLGRHTSGGRGRARPCNPLPYRGLRSARISVVACEANSARCSGQFGNGTVSNRAGIPLALRWDILVYVLPGFVLPLGQLVLTVSYAVAARAFVRGHARSLAPALRSLRYLLVVFFVAAVIGLLGAAHNIYDRLHPIRDAEPAAFSERRP